ncbi:hypothetical protein DFJ74DRAFT_693228 [Hyaloraphidium curvatum]|nr:hypothetical protein DFJ74DRAFT_693228 [Hyaloraphidium curvatum]
MEEFTYRKRKHDAAMEAWREKQKAEGPEAAGAQPPRLDVAPPMAPLSVNDTVVGALLERFRDVAAGKYRFEPGHAIAIFGLPRSGSTVLFNMVRLLVRDVDPNVVSGFSVPFDKILEWKKVSVSVVTKLHELAKPKKLESGEEDLEGFYREHEVLDGVVFSHRNPGGLVCSWCHLLGDEKCRPPKDEDEKSAKLSIFKASTRQKCRRIMSIQNNLYRNLYPLVLYDFNYETEIAARPTSPNGTAVFDPVGNADHRRVLSTLAHLRLLLGLDDRVDDWTLVKLAREMVMIRAVSIPVKGKHPADWEHPTTLMHVGSPRPTARDQADVRLRACSTTTSRPTRPGRTSRASPTPWCRPRSPRRTARRSGRR